jgi:hypothetical protein
MSDLIDAGVVQQDGDQSFVANGSKGKQQFVIGEKSLL